MPPLRAVLLFPVRPAAASAAIARAPWTALSCLAPPVALFLYLAARGCAAGDAAVTAAGALVLIAGLGGGGALAGAGARRLVPGAPRRAPAVSLVFAAWGAILFAVMLAAGRVLGLGAATPLAAGFALLVWGIVAATRVVGGEGDAEPGRALVAACVAASGAVVGLLIAGYLVHTQLVMAMPAPVSVADGRAGDPLLVRRARATSPGNTVVARDAGSARLFLAKTLPGGRLEPLGASSRPPAANCPIVGRVFFRFGGAWGGRSLR